MIKKALLAAASLAALIAPARAQEPLTSLEEAASAFSADISSAVSANSPAHPTLFIAEIQSAPPSALVEARAAFQELLASRLTGRGDFTLIEGPDASEKADLVVTGKVIPLAGTTLISLHLFARKTGATLIIEHRLLGARAPSANSEAKAPEPAETPTTVGLLAPSNFYISAAAMFREDNLAVTGRLAYRPPSRHWEAGAEFGRYHHFDNQSSAAASRRLWKLS